MSMDEQNEDIQYMDTSIDNDTMESVENLTDNENENAVAADAPINSPVNNNTPVPNTEITTTEIKVKSTLIVSPTTPGGKLDIEPVDSKNDAVFISCKYQCTVTLIDSI